MLADLHQADLLLGSNLLPVNNLQKAVTALCTFCRPITFSTTWENPSVGSEGPNFYNFALRVETSATPYELKWQIVYPIEISLGRIRSLNKNAPRTIDIDIILFDQVILDEQLWNRLYVALPLADIQPNLQHPLDHKPLKEIAASLLTQSWAIPHPEIKFDLVCKPAALIEKSYPFR